MTAARKLDEAMDERAPDARGENARDPEKERRCIVSGEIVPAHRLIRFVADPDGKIVPDVAARLPGRGAWVTASRAAITEAAQKKLFARTLKALVTAGDDLAGRTEKALVARILKASLAEAEDQDYAQIARARGFSRPAILLREVFPNALIPTVALGGVQITLLLGGTVLVERIFSYEGIGNMAIDAVINRDFPLIQGLILTFAVLFIALNLVVDVLVTLLDPRLRHG